MVQLYSLEHSTFFFNAFNDLKWPVLVKKKPFEPGVSPWITFVARSRVCNVGNSGGAPSMVGKKGAMGKHGKTWDKKKGKNHEKPTELNKKPLFSQLGENART